MELSKRTALLIKLVLLSAWCVSGPVPAHEPKAEKPRLLKVEKKPNLDKTGKPRKGTASYYGREFYGRKMADGTPMDPESNIAASRTLPLGTKAKVTNLENGKSAVVEIRDRGPYIEGRIIDLTPKVAEKLEMKTSGLATVEVQPLELPGEETSNEALAATDAVQTSGE